MTKTPTSCQTFPIGGVHPPDNKLSADKAVTAAPLPNQAIIPLSQHIGAPAACLVQPKDTVKAGQLIAQAKGFISANIHSSVSGTVLKIDQVMDTSGYKRPAVVIQVQGDEWEAGIDRSPEINKEIALSAEEIRERVKDRGIVGLGGATFPAHVKLSAPPGKTAEVVLINGVECEPYLTSDHRLMLEHGEEIAIGIRIILKALGLTRAVIGIENNKPDAIKHLRTLTADDAGIETVPLKVLYPQGGERQLVKALINREIAPPPKGLPIDVGAVVFNVATVFAIYEAVQKNKPLIERVVTVTGRDVAAPGNFRSRMGTPISQLIELAGGLPDRTGKVINGGPMMGKTLVSTDIPLTKGIGGILLLSQEVSTRKEMLDCIRCAKCVSVCPLGLEPYLLMALSQRQLYDRAESEKITNCCECACCSFSCPSNRPLLDYIRLGKTTVLQKMRAREQK